VHVWSPPPDFARPDLVRAIGKLRRVGAQVRWMTARQEHSVKLENDIVSQVVSDAVVLRSKTARERGERVLARMGIKVQRVRRWASPKVHIMESVSSRSSVTPPPPPPEEGDEH
jgi:hypothetical protein